MTDAYDVLFQNVTFHNGTYACIYLYVIVCTYIHVFVFEISEEEQVSPRARPGQSAKAKDAPGQLDEASRPEAKAFPGWFHKATLSEGETL